MADVVESKITVAYDQEVPIERPDGSRVAEIPSKPEETIGEKIDDASITAQVKMSLLAHHSTSALKTKVETTDGVVTH